MFIIFLFFNKGDCVWRRAALQGALRTWRPLSGDRKQARRGPPGQRHLPGALLAGQDAAPSPCHLPGALPRGVLTLTGCSSIMSVVFSFTILHALEGVCAVIIQILPSSLHGGEPTDSRALESTFWWPWLTSPSSWSEPLTQTTWPRAGAHAAFSVCICLAANCFSLTNYIMSCFFFFLSPFIASFKRYRF